MFSLNRIAKLATTTTRNSTRSFSSSFTLLNNHNNVDKPETDLTHPALMKDPPISEPSALTDPWELRPPPFPEVNEDGSDLSMAELILSPHPEGRDNEGTETLRKRLVYESRKRGILEMELILSNFAKSRLGELTDRQLREYDRFLTLPDWSIYYYVTNKAEAPEPWGSSWILSELLNHARNKGKKVQSMPNLENLPSKV